MTDILAKNLSKSFDGKTVFQNVNLSVPGGSTVCLMGPSGCGKTTFLRILLGLETPSDGTLEGTDVPMAAVFQEDRLAEDFSVYSGARMAAPRGTSKETVLSLLSDLGLGDAVKKPIRTLSGGMKRRVAIARALLAEAQVLILDEPFKGLDEETRAAVIRVILSHREKKTVIAVSHDEREAALLGAEVIPFPPSNA